MKNEDGLSQEVKIEQYPPLYIYAHTSKNDADAGQGQTNSNMYVIKSLIADYTSVKDPLEVSEDWSSFGTYTHMGSESNRLSKGRNMAQHIRSYAVLGYPETENVYFGKVYSKHDGEDKDMYWSYKSKGVTINSYVPCTAQTD